MQQNRHLSERGAIELRGANVMRGYFRAPEVTAQVFSADGWLLTGDIGDRDDDGFFFITGRTKELIIKGGENIAPREIDEALLRHPAVLEAATVGVPDREYGQEIAAFVVVKEGATLTAADLTRTACANWAATTRLGTCALSWNCRRGPPARCSG